MKKFNKNDLRLAFTSGLDFAVINHNMPFTSTVRNKGFDDIYSQIIEMKKKEKEMKKIIKSDKINSGN